MNIVELFVNDARTQLLTGRKPIDENDFDVLTFDVGFVASDKKIYYTKHALGKTEMGHWGLTPVGIKYLMTCLGNMFSELNQAISGINENVNVEFEKGRIAGLKEAVEACRDRAERGREGVKAGAQSCAQAIEALIKIKEAK